MYKRLLIANRGEIARRIIHTARALGLETVAVYADPDAQALHVREADQAFALGGERSADSYLRVERLLEAARATGADAVHPGYGFLSENADFAQAVLDAGLHWIGPPPEAIRALGSKAGAKALALAHGVPCLPGYAGEDQRPERFAAEADRIGYPVMVKAVAGGGGRGMRLVQAPAQLAAALASAHSEALAGFGDGRLLIERALLRPRHVELQVFADRHGHVVHLGERDCSVQRRHQKIIEEAPSPAVGPGLRQRMGECAVALARAAGYVGAGTVEFPLDGDDFYLMEMNTRLQVEHPVTEALTGLDLVDWQLRVARGELLPLRQEQIRFEGHGTEVSPHYDAMLGKLIAHAPTRDQAIARLRQGLAATVLLGLPSNRAFLSACLDHPVFRAGQALIPFLSEHGDTLRAQLSAHEDEHLSGAWPVLLWGRHGLANALGCPLERPLRVRHRERVHDWQVRETGAGRALARQGEAAAQSIELQAQPGGGWLLNLGGHRRSVHGVPLGPRRWHVQLAGVDLWLDDASYEPAGRGPGGAQALELRAPFNGRVIRIAAELGQVLAAGDALVVIESMKLEHSLAAAGPARVAELLVSPGQQVSPGQCLLRLAPLDAADLKAADLNTPAQEAQP